MLFGTLRVGAVAPSRCRTVRQTGLNLRAARRREEGRVGGVGMREPGVRIRPARSHAELARQLRIDLDLGAEGAAVAGVGVVLEAAGEDRRLLDPTPLDVIEVAVD